jgi:chemotaxis response regulator CheB
VKRVSISTSSGFLAVVLRKILARSGRLHAASDHRDARAALAAVQDDATLAIVDVELLHDGEAGAALRKQLAARRGPTLVVDARQRGVPEGLTRLRRLVVLHGRLPGELDLHTIESELLAAVGSALRPRQDTDPPPLPVSLPLPEQRIDVHQALLELIVLGVSKGGPTLLLRMLKEVSEPALPVLIVQHMPESETAGFARHLSEVTGLRFCEVGAGPLPPAGVLGVARGGNDYRVVRRPGGLHLRDTVLQGNPFHPNIDEVLLSAVSAEVTLGAAILTGMGQDGAAGALAMAQKGLPVIAQRPDTCAVAGMPQACIDNGAARVVQSPESIANTLNRWSQVARMARAAGGGP